MKQSRLWEEDKMSDIGYYSDMFHNLGKLTITLNNALNLLVRSYRTKVSDKDKEESRKTLLMFLSIAFMEDNRSQSPWTQKIGEVLKVYSGEKGTLGRLKSIRQKIDSGQRLSEDDIEILDDLISQVNQEAAFAFRKMRKAI